MSESHKNSRNDVTTAPATREILVARILWTLVVIALAIGVFGGVRRGVRERPDWGDFRHETQYVREHHQTRPGTAMFGYLPTATFVLWPFATWLPAPLGVIGFVIINTAAAVAVLWLVCRYWFGGRSPPAALALPAFLAAANFSHAISANQMTLLTLLFCVGGLTLVWRNKQIGGGVLIGAAALIKTLPALLAVYLVLTRKWRALIGFALAVVVLDIVPSVAFFGPQGALDEHRAWLRRAEWHSNRRMIEEPFLRVHRHKSNASFSAVLTRWLREPPAATRQVILYGDPPADVIRDYEANLGPDELLTLDPMPPPEGVWGEKRIDDLSWVPRFHIADLPAGVVWWIWATVLFAGFTVLCLATWRSAGRPGYDWAPMAAVWILAMLWPSPMMRHYYLAWAFPALASVWIALSRRRIRSRTDLAGAPTVPPLRGNYRGVDGDSTFIARPSPDPSLIGRGVMPRTLGACGRVLSIAALVAWFVGVLCLGWPLARWYGIHLAALALLIAAACVSWRAQKSISC